MKIENVNLFPEHPCGDCEHNDDCTSRTDCENFQNWINNLYMKCMGFNAMFNDNRITIDGKSKKDFEK